MDSIHWPSSPQRSTAIWLYERLTHWSLADMLSRPYWRHWPRQYQGQSGSVRPYVLRTISTLTSYDWNKLGLSVSYLQPKLAKLSTKCVNDSPKITTSRGLGLHSSSSSYIAHNKMGHKSIAFYRTRTLFWAGTYGRNFETRGRITKKQSCDNLTIR